MARWGEKTSAKASELTPAFHPKLPWLQLTILPLAPAESASNAPRRHLNVLARMRHMPRTRKSLLRHRDNLERALADCRSGKNFDHVSVRERDQIEAGLERRLASVLGALENDDETTERH